MIRPAAHRKGAGPRLGFLGVGWIGRHRMQAILESEVAQVSAVADPHPESAQAALALAKEAVQVDSLEQLLQQDLDGVVIATPSALHASQVRRALEAGVAVFCQKPLGRTAAEVQGLVEAASAADRLLGVDLSYRFVQGVEALRAQVQEGELGRIYGLDLVFHNAYGPDKAWFYDPLLSGGGCVMDLGIHLVDLALWVLGYPKVGTLSSRLFRGGEPLTGASGVEDYAAVQAELEGGAALRMSCSWKLQAGCDAVIEAAFYGTRGGAALRNVGGSFYDFTVERFRGTSRQLLGAPPDAWGGRAAVAWAQRLSAGEGFDPDAVRLVEVAQVLDRIYGRGP